tara:strand:- start:358 stop:777 length:420 start_codon:yes stop_codon:yes gene_type:complete
LRSQCIAKLGGGFIERFRQDTSLSCNRHEVCVAFPAWHDVDVKVFLDTRTRSSTNINPYIDALRTHGICQCALAPSHKIHEVKHLIITQVHQVNYLSIRHNEYVAGVVRISVEYGICVPLTGNHMVSFILRGLTDISEK